MTYICHTCGHTRTDATSLDRCKYVSAAGRCSGFYTRLQYNIFRLSSGKYVTKDGSPDSPFTDFAGVWDDDDLNSFLVFNFGTADRVALSTRITIIYAS